jgi:ATP-dependent DNA helicase RecQ
MLLSTIYRIEQHSGITFGAGHLMDVLRGKRTDKVAQFGHDQISTFAIGANYSESQLRSVLRQLLAIGALGINAQAFNTLYLCDPARPILRGEQSVHLRASVVADKVKSARRSTPAPKSPTIELQGTAQIRYQALKAWRGEVAKSHNLPAYVIFHDATLAAIAQSEPATLSDLQAIAGIGAKRLEAYGQEVLRVIDQAA